MRTLSGTLAWSTFEKLIDVFNAAIVSLLVIRFLGPAEYGVYAYVLQVSLVAAAIAAYGLDDLLFAELSQNRDQPDLLNAAITVRIAFGIVSGLIATLILLATVDDLHPLYFLVCTYPIVAALHIPVHWLRANLDARLITITRVACLSLGLVGRLVGVATQQDGSYFFVVLVVEFALLVGLLWWQASREGMRVSMVVLHELWAKSVWLLRRAFPLFLAAMCSVAYLQFAGLYAFNLLGAEANGHFGAAQRIMAVFYLLATALVTTLLPFVGNGEGKRISYEMSLSVVVYFGCVSSLIIWISSDLVVPAVFGDDFRDVVGPLKLLCLGLPFVCLGAGTTAWLIQEKIEWLQFGRTLAGMLFALGSVPLLGQAYGLLGLAAANAMAFAAPTIFLIFMGDGGRRLLNLQVRAVTVPAAILYAKLARKQS